MHQEFNDDKAILELVTGRGGVVAAVSKLMGEVARLARQVDRLAEGDIRAPSARGVLGSAFNAEKASLPLKQDWTAAIEASSQKEESAFAVHVLHLRDRLSGKSPATEPAPKFVEKSRS